MNHLSQLYTSLKERRRPEDIAQLVLEQLQSKLTLVERELLQKAARNSLKQQFYAYTSMLQNFQKPVGLQRQVGTAQNLFRVPVPLTPEECDDAEKIEQYIKEASSQIAKTFGSSDFKHDRLNHQARKEVGLEISRRRYNKLFRLLARMEQKLLTLVRELKKLKFQMIGKSGLASFLSWEEFSSDLNTACFIAYYTARTNLRSQYTIYGQERPYDEIAEMLFLRCVNNTKSTNWWAIAQVFPDQLVLEKLSDTQKGELLSRWYNLLEEIALLLKEIWEKSNFDRITMIVRRGNDSTTWNNTAGAWNKARSNWFGLLYAMGLAEVIEARCFGKVLRLMAADVAYWHRRAGGLDHDTFVWNEVPLPWEVMRGEKACTHHQVEEICRKYEVDPEKSGWISPKPAVRAVNFRPTPELVHGVTVANPYLARFLRELGVFSGKKIKPGKLLNGN